MRTARLAPTRSPLVRFGCSSRPVRRQTAVQESSCCSTGCTKVSHVAAIVHASRVFEGIVPARDMLCVPHGLQLIINAALHGVEYHVPDVLCVYIMRISCGA